MFDHGKEVSDPLLKSRVEEVVAMSHCVTILLDPTLDNDVAEYKHVNRLSVCASRNGSKFLLKQALQTNTYYRDVEAKFRATDVAQQAMRPAMKESLMFLKQGQYISESVEQLPR